MVKNCLRHYPKYSDYNFTSMIAWDTEQAMQIAFRKDNLVVVFQDYLTEEPFLSFLGIKHVNEQARELIELSKSAGFGKTLRLIPQTVVDHLSSKVFIIKEDRDNFDYILSVEHLSKLQGSKNEDRRYSIKKFLANYGNKLEIRQFDIKNSKPREEIMHCLGKWETIKGQTPENNAIERKAIQRLLSFADTLSISCIAFYIDGSIAAFSIFEVLDQDYAVIHFEKCHTHFKGITSYVRHQTAVRLEEVGVAYINYEQDLGIAGLRKSKEMLHPIHFLKKYNVSLAK